MIKHVTASNLLFLEKQIGKRIALESKLVPFAVKYSGRMLNLFNKVPGSTSTPVERMKDRVGINRHKTFPFGATVLAKPTETAQDNPLGVFVSCNIPWACVDNRRRLHWCFCRLKPNRS